MIKNYPSEEVRNFGDRLVAAMKIASIRSRLGGLGDCKKFDINDFDEDLREYIEGDNFDTIAIIFAAMTTKSEAIKRQQKKAFVWNKEQQPVLVRTYDLENQ